MKHSYWWLTRPDGRESTVVIVPEVDFETAQKVAERLYDGGKMDPGLAPDLPQEDFAP